MQDTVTDKPYTDRREPIPAKGDDMTKLRINEKDLRASEWKWDSKAGSYYSVVEALIDGRWEGFVSLRNPEELHRKRRSVKEW